MNSIKSLVMSSCLRNKDKFSSIITKYEEHGILHSEMLAVCSVIQNLDINLIIESGRYNGQSTEILARFFSGTKIKIVSIEIIKDQNAKYVEEKLKKYSNLILLYGDSKDLIPKILTIYQKGKVAILFDGPKGEAPIKIFKKVICDFPKVNVGFFHDMRKSTEKMPNPTRKIMKHSFNRVFFTDNNEYIENFKQLDYPIIKTGIWRPWMKGNNKIGSYGPTLAVVLPVSTERVMESEEEKTTTSNLISFLKNTKNNLKRIFTKKVTNFNLIENIKYILRNIKKVIYDK